jgi:serine/threonine protein kinase
MLHTHRPAPIAHRDLTSSNVMLTRRCGAKVDGFGLAGTSKKSTMRAGARWTTSHGALDWRAAFAGAERLLV